MNDDDLIRPTMLRPTCEMTFDEIIADLAPLQALAERIRTFEQIATSSRRERRRMKKMIGVNGRSQAGWLTTHDHRSAPNVDKTNGVRLPRP
jgi:hypothetical protein